MIELFIVAFQPHYSFLRSLWLLCSSGFEGG
jgi:hypothetical protein